MSYPTKVEIASEAVTLLDVPDTEPGYTRRRRGNKDVFYDSQGAPIRDEEALERLEGLSIPPAWSEVWICQEERGYLQATGRDDMGRKQYIYHPFWHEHRASSKYAKAMAFGAALPALREQVDGDLRRRRLDRERVSALGLAIIDRTAMRVGHDLYTDHHGSHGLTTLHKEHCSCGSRRARFTYQGKSHVERHVELRDRRLCRQIKRLYELPGPYLLQYSGETPHRVLADELNGYLARHLGEQWSVKDFRTWWGSVKALEHLLPRGEQRPKTEDEEEAMTWRRGAIKEAIAHASTFLGNTPSVCRNYYVHSEILQGAQQGWLWERAVELEHDAQEPTLHSRAERVMLAMLGEGNGSL